MKLMRARHSGFCYGVRRAIQLVDQALKDGRRPLASLGPLIHNPQEVARLAALGIEPRDNIERCAGRLTLVRTHGITMEEQALAQELSIELIDATCPHVVLPRRSIQAFGREGRTVLLLGDQGHPEVRALVSYRQGPVFVVKGHGDLPILPPQTPIGIVAQTTQSKDALAELVLEARRRFRDVKVKGTICLDTHKRQEEGIQLAGQVDLALIVGGRNSANTARLQALCRAVQPRSYHVESAAELAALSFESVERVGILSGASTPDWVIDEVEDYLQAKCTE